MTIAMSTPEELRQKMIDSEKFELDAQAAHQKIAQERFTRCADEAVKLVTESQARRIAREEAKKVLCQQREYDEERAMRLDPEVFINMLAAQKPVKDFDKNVKASDKKTNTAGIIGWIAGIACVVLAAIVGVIIWM